jgi:anti-sigma-K factor RskA
VSVPTEPSIDEAVSARKDLSSRADAGVRGTNFRAACATMSLLVAAAVIAACVMYSVGVASRTRAIESELAIQRGLAAFLSSPETATIVLAGTEEAPNARLKLAYDRVSGRALLFGYDLPRPPPGRAYQLWYIAAGVPLAGRVFAPDASGRGSWDEDVPAEGREASVFTVTLEPAGGVATPSGPMILKSVSLS